VELGSKKMKKQARRSWELQLRRWKLYIERGWVR
jgi:hypothetical protein